MYRRTVDFAFSDFNSMKCFVFNQKKYKIIMIQIYKKNNETTLKNATTLHLLSETTNIFN